MKTAKLTVFMQNFKLIRLFFSLYSTQQEVIYHTPNVFVLPGQNMLEENIKRCQWRSALNLYSMWLPSEGEICGCKMTFCPIEVLHVTSCTHYLRASCHIVHDTTTNGWLGDFLEIAWNCVKLVAKMVLQQKTSLRLFWSFADCHCWLYFSWKSCLQTLTMY